MAVDQLIEDDDDYYYVNESGAMVTNQWVAIENEDAGEEDEPDYYWYYFQANGKAYKRSDSASESSISAKTINGKKYAFDEEGRMIASWFSEDVESGSTSTASEDSTASTAEVAEFTRGFKYFSDPEDGARYTRGWFKVVPGYYLEEDEYNDGDDYWYYADGNGELYANEIKTIKGKKYAFNENGRMLDGLVLLEMEAKSNSSSSKGAGIHGEDDDKLYAAGKLIEADSDDKYQVVLYIENKGSNGVDDVANDLKLIELDAEEFLDYCVEITEENASEYGMEFDEDETTWVLDLTDEKKAEIAGEYGIETLGDEAVVEFNLVNTSGSMVKNKSAAKDGEDYEFDVDNYEIQSVTIEN